MTHRYLRVQPSANAADAAAGWVTYLDAEGDRIEIQPPDASTVYDSIPPEEDPPTAQDGFANALHRLALETDCIHPAEIIASWILVGTAVSSDITKTSYFRILPGGIQASYVTLGLLDCATVMERDWILNNDDDDDQ